jgi:agmatine/peptidylarginine deiminase
LALVVLFPVAVLAADEKPKDPYYDSVSFWDEEKNGPLPRWREGGTPEPDPDQPLVPYSIDIRSYRDVPTTGVITAPPEYSPTDGVLFRYSTGGWSTFVTDMVAALTGDPAYDEKAYVVVSNSSQQSSAESQFSAAGADLTKVHFIIMPSDSIWLRDYGPHFIWQDGARAIVDSHYYPGRNLDNYIPTLLADDYFLLPSYDIGLVYSGGNFQPGPNRTGYTTGIVYGDNPGFTEQYIGELYNAYQGIDTLHIFPQLPGSVDGTGHIDMWFYLVDEDTVIISEFLPGSNAEAITITENGADYMESIGFEVIRTPDHNGFHPNGTTHYTYTNAFRVNDRIFISKFGDGDPDHEHRDLQALTAWQAAAPEAEIIQISSYDIIWAAGALHCTVMQVPRRTEPEPGACVVSPGGGELLVSGGTHDLLWAATDDDYVDAVDLLYSTDGGSVYDGTIATGEPDDGHFSWTVPTADSAGAFVKVVAHDKDGNSGEAVSDAAFVMTDGFQHLYDFSSGAGVDKWGWGYRTSSWSQLDGIRHPAGVASEISTLESGAYSKIAASDATGDDYDTNRYRAPDPNSGYEGTHIFEFVIDEDPSTILDIGIHWEGYADTCQQIELYVWDDVEQQWCDGKGNCGENRYMDNHAANRDDYLSGHIRGGFERYVDVSGRLTLLLYVEYASQRSMHDYLSVTVSYGDCPETPDMDSDGSGDGCDNCPDLSNPGQEDGDADRAGDLCDNCPAVANSGQADVDSDGPGDGCDNCPLAPNGDQADFDSDGAGDSCDICPFDADPGQSDSDSDGLGDACESCPYDPDNDLDGDSSCADVDNCPVEFNAAQADSDSDTIGDLCDICPQNWDQGQADGDGDGAGDACDCQSADPGDLRPAEVGGLDFDKPAVGTAGISWPPSTGADAYSVTRGLISSLAGGYGSCLDEAVYTAGFEDAEMPASGEGFFYLLQGHNFDCGLGSMGYDSAESERASGVDPCLGQPHTDSYASGEESVTGTVLGSYLDTTSSNDVPEAITEEESGGNPSNRYSYLEHRWTVSVAAGSVQELHVEGVRSASPDGDGFVFEYSEDGDSNWWPVSMTVLPTTDNDVDLVGSLPSSLSGSVMVRVVDTDRTPGRRNLDTVWVDELFVRTVP